MAEELYNSNYATWLSNANISPANSPPSLYDTIQGILLNMNTGAGSLLGYAFYAPSSVDTSTTVASSTGLTSVYFSTGHDQPVTFVGPQSGKVLFTMTAFVKGGAAAATSTIFGITSQTQASSPGTVVGVLGLAQLTPTGTAADNGVVCTMAQVVSVTAGTSYTWYGAAMYSGTGTTILAQGTTSQTTVPTGSPYSVTVVAA